MIRRCGLAAVFAFSSAVASAPLHAQVGGAGSVVNGRVVVQVFVTLSDDETPYHPISGLPLGFIRTPRDTSIAVTDRSGSAIVLLPPGRYRVVSLGPTHWKGWRYAWNTPIDVEPEMGQINLRRKEATATKVVSTTVTVSNGEAVERTVERVKPPVQAAPAPAPAAPVAVFVPTPAPAPEPVPEHVEHVDVPVAVIKKQAAMPLPAFGRSNTKGFFIGLDVEGNGLMTNAPGASTESGEGGGVILGYGFNRHVSLYADGSDALMNAATGGTYSLAHADLGFRVHFRSGPHALVPFLEFGATGRTVSTTQGTTTYSSTGVGGSAGAGFNAYFTRSVALSAAVDWSIGSFNNYQIDNLGVAGPSVDAQTARVHLGLVWFP
jgi:hypothetical protein